MECINLDETIVLASDLSSISQIESIIDGQSQLLHLDDEIYGKYMLSVVECINNAIVHGNKLDPSKKVTMHYNINNERIVITISDEGEGFNPDCLPDPTAEENLVRECGRGVFLMRHLSDELSFSDSGRSVTMKFNLK